MFNKIIALVSTVVVIVNVYLINKRAKEKNAILARCSNAVELTRYEDKIDELLAMQKKNVSKLRVN